MVILNKYHDEDDLLESSTDAPPSYETVSAAHSGRPNNYPLDEKLPRQPAPPSTHSVVGASTSRPVNNPSSWLSTCSFSTSRTSKQVRQTVLALVRDLVLDAESPSTPSLLDSCAAACRTYRLDLSALLQEPSIERRSAIYWAILNRHDALLSSLLAHAAPLSRATASEIRLACLVSANQALFQSLRCQREPFTKHGVAPPLSTSPGTDALLLGAMPADEVSIREMEGHVGEFVAEMRINLWQKRMRVSGRVGVEFIARGRIWSLTFFSPPPTARMAVGMWQVALCLLEHSPPTFIDSRLVVDLPPLPSNLLSSQASDLLISLSPPPDDPRSPAARSPPPSSPRPWHESRSKSKAPQTIQVRLKSAYRLAHRASSTFLTALDAAFSNEKEWSPPRVEQWTDDGGSTYTNAIVVPLNDGAGEELLYDNTPFIAMDGTLHVRLEAQLGKPDATECVIC